MQRNKSQLDNFMQDNMNSEKNAVEISNSEKCRYVTCW